MIYLDIKLKYKDKLCNSIVTDWKKDGSLISALSKVLELNL